MTHNPYAAPQAELGLAPQPAGTPRLPAWNGRIGRLRFVAYCLLGVAATALYVVLYVVLLEVMGILADEHGALRAMARQGLGGSALLLWALALVTAIRRRLHDFDVSGWWTLLLLLPLFQFIFLIYLAVAPGTPASNRFGPQAAPASLRVKAVLAIGCLLLGWLIARRFL